MSKDQNKKTMTSAKRSLILYVRVVCAFFLLGVLLAVLYWFGFHSYPNVAEWAEPGSHQAIVYDGETYYLSGQIGKNGLTKSKYPIDKILGQIKDDGTPVQTEPETTVETETELEIDSEDTEILEETELESVIPPAGAEFFQNKQHTYILYSVEKNEQFLIVLETDGEHYLYYQEGFKNPLEPKG